ncbi:MULTISPECIES: hypothetical protein [Mumia]|uniref:hypothetical protein n=1 Tax=Mumia TaxID=1546255 RepID=UPI00142308FB|nr:MULTISPECIES: hypothetical protein [unclassified Mumia]QMW67201.1 hypothetical protein H4N58_04575 [Mumia sp. ZJ1417]
MPRPLVLLLGAALGTFATLAALLVVRTVIGSTNLGVDERTLACGTESGPAQVCVVRRERTELLVVPGLREITVRRTGIPRMLVADDPFGSSADDALHVDLAGGVTVRGPAYALRWEAAEVDSLLTD